MPDATLAEEKPEADPTVRLEGGAEPVVDSGPCCEKCGAPTDAAACPHCGWYPSLGIHVEIDDAYEQAMLATPVEGDADAAETEPVTPGLLKHLEVWQGLIPTWGWLMIGTAAGVVALAIGARVATLASPTLQAYCGVGGLLLGLAIAMVAHVVGFVLCSFEDADFGVTDVLIKPFKVWKQIAGELPERVWLADTGVAGVSMALSAALIVGGIPYDRLLDWGIKARAKPNLVGAIAKQAAQNGGGDKDLEAAIGDFAGQADGVQQAAGAGQGKKPKAAEKPRENLDCLIIGYQLSKEGSLRTLLLAADTSGRLKYVGKVSPEIESREAAELVEKFQKSSSTRPFVKTPESGAWVRPKYTCRVSYAEWPQGRRPTDLRWDSLLDELSW